MKPPNASELQLTVPAGLADAYGEWAWDLAYRGVQESVTYRLVHPNGDRRYVKLTVSDWFPSLLDERARMEWARPYLPVPMVIESGATSRVHWLVTEALAGVDATDVQWIREPRQVVRLLAEGLRRFHGAPVAACPFDFRVDAALRQVERRIAAGILEPERDLHDEYRHLSVEQAFEQLQRTRPTSEDLVVCHGDYCFPNVIIDKGHVAGFVDLGELGFADRWWDLAVATWSTTWNVGPGYENYFLEAYGAEPDRERMAFYRLLYDMVS